MAAPLPAPAGQVLFVCTGNAARSVMAGVIFSTLAPEWGVTSAGTHVIEGQPVSWRTRDALSALGFSTGSHRSRQLRDTDVAAADLVVGLAPEHVAYVRRIHSGAAARTATLKRLTRDLGPDGLGGLEALALGGVELGLWEEVVDPAGGDIDVFHECAAEVLALTTVLVGVLTGGF